MGLMKAIRQAKPKPFGTIEIATISSEHWRMLKTTEAHVYNTLKTFYRGNSQSFKAPFALLKQRTRIQHGETLNGAIKGLQEKSWIEVVRYAKHGTGRGLRVKSNEYKLTFKFDQQRW